MSQEIVKILRVETQGSERTVKSLKDEISALKDALLNSEKGTKTYDDIVKQLKSDYNDLSTVINAGKKDVEALEGSYNYLVKTMSELKKEWRATTDEVKRNQLGQEIDNINTQLKEMDASIGNYQRNVGNYTESFSDAMKQQQEATEVTRAKLESVSKVATGLASGYAAVQGAMAIMGVENEKLEKTFVKLQAAIALAQGIGGMKDLIEGVGTAKVAFKGAITGVKTFITALKGMKAALMATGIGALVVALGTIVAYWDDIKNFVGLDSQVRDLNTEVENLKKHLTEKDDEDNFILRMKAAAGATKDELFELELQMLKVKQTEARNKKQDIGFELDSLKRKQKEWFSGVSQEDVDEAQAAYDKALAIEKEYSNAIQKVIQNRKVYKKQQETDAAKAAKKAAQDAAKAEADAAAAEAKAKKKAADELEKELAKESRLNLLDEKNRELEILRLKYEEEQKLLVGRNKALLDLRKEYERNKQAIIDKYDKEELVNNFNRSMANIDTNQSFKEAESENKYQGIADAESSKKNWGGFTVDNPASEIQIEIDKLSELRQIRLDAHNERLAQIETMLSSELIAGQMRIDLENEKNNLIRENAIEEQSFILANSKLQKQKINEEKKLKQQQVTATINTTKSMLSAVSSLMKDGSKEQKGVASAIATMDALQAANGAYAAMASIPVVGPALGAAAAAAALIAGYANVKAIWAVDESGSNTSTMAGNASVTPTFNAEQAMPVQYTRNIMTDREMDTLNQPQKVYVLESDIQETHKKVEVTENNATF